MQDNTKVHQQKRDNDPQHNPQESGTELETVKSFIPPKTGINPVPVQKKSNPIQKMQEMSGKDKPYYFQPNAIQTIQQKKEEEKIKQLKQGNEESPGLLTSEPSQKMPETVQAKMENSFGTDFSDVNIHEGDNAVKMNAQAYTQGNDIHFAPGKYEPETQSGQELLGHELTHVVQQSQGLVQPTAQMKGVNINDASSLEQEADEMGKKAARGETATVVQQTSSQSMQRKALDADKVEPYFKDYEKFAQAELDHWYSKATIDDDDDKLTGAMFANAARKIYDDKKDLSYVVPVEYALAQAKLEGGLMGKERTEGNKFNVGAFDSGVTGTETSINSTEKGFDAYYKLMSESFLNNKSADQLLENGNFTTKSGGVYASNPFYEIEIKSEIGLMHYRNSAIVLSASVGSGKTNAAKDVETVGKMLAELGYLGKDKVTDKEEVCDAILEFQKKEMAPEDEDWFEKRMDLVTNPVDKSNMEKKAEMFTDGIVGKAGMTIGLLYYKTYLNNKIPSINDGTATSGASVSETPKATEESWTDKILNSGKGLFNSLFGSDTENKAPAPKDAAADTTVLTGIVNGKQVGTKDQVIKIQTSLKALGYYKGTADGYITKKDGSESDTVKAIKAFQTAKNLTVTGNIDGQTSAALTTAVAALPAAATSTPAAGTGTQTATVTATTPSAAEKKTAETVYNQYDGEMLAIGKEMLKMSKTDPQFVISMFEYLSWYEKDNLAYNLSTHLTESDLASVDKKLIQRIYDELDSGYTKDVEVKQMEKLKKFLPQTEVKTEAKEENKSEYKNADMELSGSVGKAGKNKAKDVIKVQNLLISLSYLSASSSEYTSVKAAAGQTPEKVIEESQLSDTIKAIKQYQKYAATTQASMNSQDGRVDKGGYVNNSMKELNRVYNQYNEQKFEDEVANVLSNDQWRCQFRWGFNFKEDADEKEYMDYVKELTGLDDPADLHEATAEQIQDVKQKFHGNKNFWNDELKTQSIRTSQKARDTKPNEVCCWDTANLMLGFTGTSEKGENSKIQTFVQESGSGKLTNQAALGVKYIDGQLKAGKAVFVGIDKGDLHTDRNEATTDHYILIIGKHKEGDNWYYNYFDPGRTSKANGTSQANNRLYIGTDKKTVSNGDHKLSQVRVNNE